MSDSGDVIKRNFNSDIDRANAQFGRMFPGLVNAVAHERMTTEELAEYTARKSLPPVNSNWTLIATVVYDPKEKSVEYLYARDVGKDNWPDMLD